MGWVSCLEDAIDRIADFLHDAEHTLRLPPTDVSAEELRLKIKGQIFSLQTLKTELEGYLAIATDPSLTLAEEVSRLRQTVETQKIDDRSLRERIDKLTENAAQIETILRETQQNLRREQRKHQTDIERIFKEDPGRVYDKLSPWHRLDELKPDR